MTPDEIRSTFGTWVANIGRAPHDGEREEWARVFRDAGASVVRAAIDEYAASAPRFASLMGLRVVFARLAPDDGRHVEEAMAWLRDERYRAYGFVFTGSRHATLTAQKVRALCATHATALVDAGQTLAAWSSTSGHEARDRARTARHALEAAGYDYMPEWDRGPNGCVEWDLATDAADVGEPIAPPATVAGRRALERLRRDVELWNAGEREAYQVRALREIGRAAA